LTRIYNKPTLHVSFDCISNGCGDHNCAVDVAVEERQRHPQGRRRAVGKKNLSLQNNRIFIAKSRYDKVDERRVEQNQFDKAGRSGHRSNVGRIGVRKDLHRVEDREPEGEREEPQEEGS